LTDQHDHQVFQDKLHHLVADSPMSTVQMTVIVMCFILNMIDGMDILVVSFTATKLEAEWGLSKSELGLIFSAGLVGMMVGCLFMAPFADKIGRAKMLLISTTGVAISMLTTAMINDYGFMLFLRLITGIGIGCLLPTMAAMASEFANEKSRNFSVAFFQAGWPIGAIITGLFVSWAVPIYGWRVAYMTAGIISAGMLPLIILFMPESLEFLGKRQPRNALARINILLKSMGHSEIETLPPKPVSTEKRAMVRKLLDGNLKRPTILLWIGVFFSFMTLYTLISWIPNIASSSGMPFDLATYAGTALNVGAFLGTICIGWLSAWFGLNRLLFIYMLSAFAFMVIYANVPLSYPILFALIILIGFSVQGGMTGFYPAAARVYPLNIRASGIGWAMGIGRTGAIAGPALFGIIFDSGVSIQTLFIIFSIPLILSGLAACFIPSENLNPVTS
jgi:MFS transporter, AAHS family, 4-hydroxybenzoate transporter